MTYNEQSAIRHITSKDNLTSMTLKSDIASKYIVQNELILDLFKMIKKTNRSKVEGISLQETLQIDDNVTYLKDWINQLENDIESLQKSDSNDNESKSDVDIECLKLDGMIKSLENEFLHPNDNELKLQNDKILNDYSQTFGKIVYEVKGNMTQDSDNLNLGQDEDDEQEREISENNNDNNNGDDGSESTESNYKSSIYYRLSKPVRFSDVDYQQGEYKRQKLDDEEKADDVVELGDDEEQVVNDEPVADEVADEQEEQENGEVEQEEQEEQEQQEEQDSNTEPSNQ
ncbi:hypothetical protein CANARDRAFT_24066 [[Candida] arabinofermentans NRRL YB-2248]|uniref:Uncharacterized protein n=1 Tax=[Candida] arabinofermentans NRRL YB-2248 TaxID=983967 RepID=A0A1E4SXW8_9ASCO|nr:hypothetical protein CANARDRAFT_24066 [[Candida] arabinofermentans NRRL YB-2248]